jgi:monoamine oxidase
MTTRRGFLTRVGQAGGFGAAYVMMQSLGLLEIPASRASTIALPENSGTGKALESPEWWRLGNLRKPDINA